MSKPGSLNSNWSLAPASEREAADIFDVVPWKKCFIIVGLKEQQISEHSLLFFSNKLIVFLAAKCCDWVWVRREGR